MKYADWLRTRMNRHDRPEDEEEEPAFRPAVVPGKRTRTMSLAPTTGETAPVQKRDAPRANPPGQRRPPAHDASLDVAFRPDLHGESSESDDRSIQQIASKGVSGTSRPLPFRDAIQRAFGRHDVANVRAHIGGAAGEAAREMGAAAYAVGEQVAFGRTPDLHTAAHEAAHVIQQRGGVSLEGGMGQAGDIYERHADAVADATVQGRSAEGLLDGFASRGGESRTGIQMRPESGQRSRPAEQPADGNAQEEEGSTGPASPVTPDVLSRIYRGAGGDAGTVRAFVSRLTEAQIAAASAESESHLQGEEARQGANPLRGERVDRRGNPVRGEAAQQEGRRDANRYHHVRWDQEGYDDSDSDRWLGASIRPTATASGEHHDTLRGSFNQHRQEELSRLCGGPVTHAQVLCARSLAQQHGEPGLAEAVRRMLFTASEYSTVDTLNPEQSGRYRPARGQTFCNLYSFDVMRAMGVVEEALPGGDANQAAGWLSGAGARRYWRRLSGVEQAQQRANEGHLVIIAAQSTRFAGHVSVVMPENRGRASAHRDEDGHVDSPVESNAGGGSMTGSGDSQRPSANWRAENRTDLYASDPETYQAGRHAQWWEHGHTNAGFYEYIGSATNPDRLGGERSLGHQ